MSIHFSKKYIIGVVLTAFVGSGIFLLWYTTQSHGTQFAIFLTKFSHDHTIFLKKLYLVGNYFGSIGNVLTGWIIPNIQDAQNTGTYNKIIARFAFIIFLATVFFAFIALKTKKNSWKIISFFLLWIFLWYIPDWLFEPRVPMAGAHRYLLISGVGMSLLLGYLISLVKNRLIVLAIIGVILFANIFTIQRILTYQETFRSQKAFNNIWQVVEKEASQKNGPNIFVFTGKDPYVGMIAGLTGGIPYALNKGITKQYNLPLVTGDPSVILHYLCDRNYPQVGRTTVMLQKTKIPLTHVFAWDITSSTSIRSYTKDERVFLKGYAKANGCDL